MRITVENSKGQYSKRDISIKTLRYKYERVGGRIPYWKAKDPYQAAKDRQNARLDRLQAYQARPKTNRKTLSHLKRSVASGKASLGRARRAESCLERVQEHRIQEDYTVEFENPSDGRIIAQVVKARSPKQAEDFARSLGPWSTWTVLRSTRGQPSERVEDVYRVGPVNVKRGGI
jgi:hypothetical protein